MVSIRRHLHLILIGLILLGTYSSSCHAQDASETGYIGLGAGTLGFFGDVNDRNSAFAPTLGRNAFHLSLHAPLSPHIEGGIEAMFGTLGARERGTERNLNFESEIRSAGLFVLYDFEGILPDERTVSPTISIGVSGFEFLSKADMMDANGNVYNYWSDGTIRDMPEEAEGSSAAVIVNPDYVYETDLRELDLDGFGEYSERGFAFPIGLGFRFDLGKYVDFDMHTRLYLTTTDYIDNITDESLGSRAGDSQNDRWLYTGFALSYGFHKKSELKGTDVLDQEFLANLDDRGDEDRDGVLDLLDRCPHSPQDVKVDIHGCPLDEDEDGVPDYLDLELGSPEGAHVNADGVALDDAYFEKRLSLYLSETDINFVEGTVESASIPKPIFTPRPGKKYMVQVGETAEGIPSDLASQLLSLPDVQTINQGDTVLYMVGDYETLPEAVKRQLQLSESGIDGTVVSSEDGEVTNESTEARKVKRELSESEEAIGESTSVNEEISVVWRVQVGAFQFPLSYNLFSSIDDVITINGDDGLTRYFSGVYDNRSDAEKYRGILQNSGFNDAFLAAFRGGQRINVREAIGNQRSETTDDLWDRPSPDAFDERLVKYRIVLVRTVGSIETDKLEQLREVGRVDQEFLGDETLYIIGFYKDKALALEQVTDYRNAGLPEAELIGSFNGELIELDEIEMMKEK